HWLNGSKIVDFEAWTPEWFALKNSGKWTSAPEYGLSETGYISLQDHGSKAWFRNLKIKELPKKEKPAVALFNGVDLSNWVAYGTEKWYVQDSLLVCESGPDKGYGYLGTQLYYKDFDLAADFKQVSNGNSGIFFRSTVEGTTVSGWQVEVAPKGNDSGGVYESYGRGWLHQIPDDKEDILKPGEWNTMRVKVIGSDVTTWLNGQEMTHLNDSLIGTANGRIALQIHDGGGIKVQWKNLVIKPL
ncbi:MAG TPA: family 16 glycoside hydrolase, partial [Prolixibacteraceae bacterium]